MKKIISITLAAILACGVFVGCSSSKKMSDGTYRAEMAEADSHGWVDFVEIKVSDGKIVDVDYDSLSSQDGSRKSESAEYDQAMKDAGSATWPSDFMPKLEAQLIEKQDVNKVDAIAGATQSTDSFKLLVKELKGSMESGKTETVKVKAPAK